MVTVDPDETDRPTLPEPGPDGEPTFEEPAGAPPAVEDTPGRSTEF